MAARSKYVVLGQFLAAEPPEITTVTLPLTEIERIIDAPLPPTARLRTWWANADREPQGRAWLDVGWRVQGAKLWAPVPAVTFVRADSRA